MKVIGAGFGRTGTLSLQSALETLGFAKCYHMVEVFKNQSHTKLWEDANQGNLSDWEQIFKGYEATVDWPACTFYQELMARYPDAKVLLTTREFESWYKSARETIYEVSHGFPMNYAMRFAVMFRGPGRMASSIVWGRTFNYQFLDKAYAKQVFDAHIEEVKRVVPPERLLVYNVKQGWEPLCQFLGVPVPQMPFPHLNDTDEFKRNILTVRIMASLTLLAPIALMVGLLWYLLS